MVPIKTDHNIAGGACKALLIGPAISAVQFGNNDGSPGACHLRRSICGVVVDDDDFVNIGWQSLQYLLDGDLLVQTRYDDRDPVVLIHLSVNLDSFAERMAHKLKAKVHQPEEVLPVRRGDLPGPHEEQGIDGSENSEIQSELCQDEVPDTTQGFHRWKSTVQEHHRQNRQQTGCE